MCAGPATNAQPDGAAQVEWLLDADLLRRCHVGADCALALPAVEVCAPGVAGSVVVRAGGQVFLDEQGGVHWAVQLPAGARAIHGQQVGPRKPALRVAVDSWELGEGEEVPRRCARDSWPLDDHAEQGSLNLRLALFSVALPGDLARLPDGMRLGQVLAEGKNGSVRLVHEETGESDEWVAKIPAKSRAASDLFVEAFALRRLQAAGGGCSCPRLRGLFHDHGLGSDALLMQRLGRDLESLRLDPAVCPAARLGRRAVVEVGVQVVAQLEDIHSQGLAHGDLKPKNLMLPARAQVGRPPATDPDAPLAVLLVDFGTCRPYRLGTLHASPRKGAAAVGTTRFCSLPAHSGERSPRSDLESLAYVLVYLATGGLPWQGCTASSKREHSAQIRERKLDFQLLERHIRSALEGDPTLAEVLTQLAASARALQFAEAPDYVALRKLLQSARASPWAQGVAIQSPSSLSE